MGRDSESDNEGKIRNRTSTADRERQWQTVQSSDDEGNVAKNGTDEAHSRKRRAENTDDNSSDSDSSSSSSSGSSSSSESSGARKRSRKSKKESKDKDKKHHKRHKKDKHKHKKDKKDKKNDKKKSKDKDRKHKSSSTHSSKSVNQNEYGKYGIIRDEHIFHKQRYTVLSFFFFIISPFSLCTTIIFYTGNSKHIWMRCVGYPA
jgi:hypothetical protein